MKFSKTIITAATLVWGGIAVAAPTADEIKQLGTTLTPWGAEKVGNKEGTIPEYTGGVKNPPQVANYNSGVLPDPFKDDKELFRIDAKNMDKYADKLSAGIQAQIKKYPGTFYVSVYPTRRSASYPQQVLDNTMKNATRCSLKDEGNTLDISKGCRGGFAFPIPKDGYEAMWNRSTAYVGPRLRHSISWMGKANGEAVMVNDIYSYEYNQLYDKEAASPSRYWEMRSEFIGPTRLVGNTTLYVDALDNERKAWAYTAGTRRTRLAPDYAADMPIAATGGSMLYDQIDMFSGSLDRFAWKLLGKREIYIPYNNYNLADSPPKECTFEGGLMMAGHANPKCIRFELHRVWHIQGMRKEGKRHVFSRRDYYFDEDTWIGGLADAYDHNGKLYIVQWTTIRPDYVKNVPLPNGDHANFDLNSGTYHFPFTPKAWILDQPIKGLSPEMMPKFVLTPPG